MSKRTQSIRSLFAAGNDEGQTTERRGPSQRVTSGAVRSLQDTFSEVEREYEALRKRVAEGGLPVELDPAVVDPSPFADRFVDHDLAAFEALRASILEHGQEIPILVRPHPTDVGRYQVAYGHRRLRAATDLGLQVKAYVRDLDDDRLVVAQGIENSAREDLSFIERAAFAYKLESSGFQRTLIQSALSVDRAEVSKLIAVAQSVPDWVVTAIGRAPKVGRGRWQEMADLFKDKSSETKARKAIQEKSFVHKDTEDRFTTILRALKKAEVSERDRVQPASVARSTDGVDIAVLSVSSKHCKIQLDRQRDEAFALFVMDQLPALYESFNKEK